MLVRIWNIVSEGRSVTWGCVDYTNLEELNSDTAGEWLRSPAPMEEEPFGQGQDWSLTFPGALYGGLSGHIHFYLRERIPNPEKRRFLLNAIHVLAGRELAHLFPRRRGRLWGVDLPPVDAEYRIELLFQAVELAQGTQRLELHRWASAVMSVLNKKKHPRYGFWCGWGWSWQAALIYFWWP